MTGTIIERVRASGKCPPSLIRDVADNKFEAAVEKVVDSNELTLSPGQSVPGDFKKLLEVSLR